MPGRSRRSRSTRRRPGGHGRSRWSATLHFTSTRAELLTTPHERAQPTPPSAAPQPLAAGVRSSPRSCSRSSSLGIALGEALNDGPPAPSTETYVRTLEPVPQQPATTTSP